jgi:hypothetical protein
MHHSALHRKAIFPDPYGFLKIIDSDFSAIENSERAFFSSDRKNTINNQRRSSLILGLLRQRLSIPTKCARLVRFLGSNRHGPDANCYSIAPKRARGDRNRQWTIVGQPTTMVFVAIENINHKSKKRKGTALDQGLTMSSSLKNQPDSFH